MPDHLGGRVTPAGSVQPRTWEFHGAYRSLRSSGSARDAARSLINLVNVQGPGTVGLTPAQLLAVVADGLDSLDPRSRWRDWWSKAAGTGLVLTNRPSPQRGPPTHAVRSDPHSTDTYLGINIGGNFLRVVRITGDRVESDRESIPLDGTHTWSSARQFVDSLRLDRLGGNPRGIGIAWSAPRTAIGLRAMSLRMERSGTVGALLHDGRLDSLLTELCGCPVRSWNDGEAVAAAEVRPNGRDRPLLVLKLGTSIASGLATADGVCSLPLQLAKCLLPTAPILPYEHPAVGLWGTARDFLGATSVRHTYGALSGQDNATYRQFCEAAQRLDPFAVKIARSGAAALAELCSLMGALWSGVDLVVTGRNVKDPIFRELFFGWISAELRERGSTTSLHVPFHDVDLCAAIGAAILTRATIV